MRVIICGAGQVGYNIAIYLSREDNDITIIDKNPRLINEINDAMDVNGLVGHASNPEVLAQAGASEADMIIAVTYSDEVNMVACQVAHSLFNVPRKVARVRDQAYLDPAWSNLFSRAHMPIDVIISPEIEVARSITQRILTPGTTNAISLADGEILFVGVICLENCPVVNTQLKQLSALFPDLNIKIGLIMRGMHTFMPEPDDQLQVGDEVHYFIESRHLRRSMAVFGHEEQKARYAVIMGGGNIGLFLCNLLQREQKNIQLKIIEKSPERARFLSEHLQDITIIEGDGLDKEIMEEANIKQAETIIAVTENDETNILGSLLAKQYGCERAITLVNNTTYNALVSHLGIDAIVSPRASTVSRIMQNVRRGRIKALHTLRDGQAEVIEAEVIDTTQMANKRLASLGLPKGVIVGVIVRDGAPITMNDETVIKPGDRIITLAVEGKARGVEKMFTVQVDLF